ncbi:MAG: NADH-quinone oxidoreductase subunit A [Bernardetiaceae bacterium]|nr:NADH-quinone oxidoreductase subunit A [Bernardetiaceae bacterium]
MNESTEISEFGIVLLFLIGGLMLTLIGMGLGSFLRPHRPNEEKNTSYECGEDPVGGAWQPFDVRFYVMALLFVLFEVELFFLFPWAMILTYEGAVAEWSLFMLIEGFIFVGILLVGLVYAWRKGLLDWIRPEARPSSFTSRIPEQIYKQFKS